MKTLNRFVIPAVITLNLIHLLLPFGYKVNSSFNPAISILALGICLFFISKHSNLKKDSLFVFSLIASVITQNISNQVNRGVPDYINFWVFNSNIPDILIFTTLLTWWYYRVYKFPKLNPAK
jgi:hypothetical protein